jgi:hypothetical protein
VDSANSISQVIIAFMLSASMTVTAVVFVYLSYSMPDHIIRLDHRQSATEKATPPTVLRVLELVLVELAEPLASAVSSQSGEGASEAQSRSARGSCQSIHSYPERSITRSRCCKSSRYHCEPVHAEFYRISYRFRSSLIFCSHTSCHFG